MIDTPRTDAAMLMAPRAELDFARQLERELIESERLRCVMIDAVGFIVVGPSDDLSEVSHLINEVDRLKAELAKANSICNERSLERLRAVRDLEGWKKLAARQDEEHAKTLAEVETLKLALDKIHAHHKTCIDNHIERENALRAELAAAKKDSAGLRAELQNIASADIPAMRKDFGQDADRQFREWALNRARAALAKAEVK